jgi:hypothetical protein
MIRKDEIIIKGLEYIQAKFIVLDVLSLNKKILEGLTAKKEIHAKIISRIAGDLGIKEAICSFDARVDT